MVSFYWLPGKQVVILLLTAVFVSACSGSTDSQSSSETTVVVAGDENVAMEQGASSEMSDEVPTAPIDTTTVSAGEVVTSNPAQNSDDSSTQSTGLARITFDITVPVYVSNALQVKLVSGEKVTSASWINDETWVVSDDFPVDIENYVVITFSDRNGDITLGQFETVFTLDASAAKTIRIGAIEFDTQAFDNDNDGVSNLDELLTGRNPDGDDLSEPEQVILELVADKTLRLRWSASAGAEFYRVLENPNGMSGFVQVGNDLAATTLSFDQRVALYTKTNVRYIVQACNTNGCVDSNEQMLSGSLHEAAGIFQADKDDFPESFPNQYFTLEYFGVSVTLSGDGNSMAVGVSEKKYNDYQNLYYYQGVYVMERIDGKWQKQAYLSPRHSTIDTFFGYSMSFSEDGNTLAIGARYDRNAATGINSEIVDLTARHSGAAYVFTRVDGLWQEQAYIKADNADADDEFGSSVSLSSDGNTLAIGASSEDGSSSGVDGLQSDNMAKDSGAVYVYTRGDDGWRQHAYIKASNTGEGDGFGSSIALSKDGKVLAVAASGEDSASIGINGNQDDNGAPRSGAVYLFSNSSGDWEQKAYIKASNAQSEDLFGHSVALNIDGSVLAIGALWESSIATGINGIENDNSAQLSGAAYVFINNDDIWQQQAYIKANNSDEKDTFGSRVSLSADGDVMAIGAYAESSSAIGINGDQNDNSAPGSGAVYVFTYDNAWQQEAYIKSSIVNESGSFGAYVSLSSDGESLAVSATREDTGAVYLY